MTDATGCIVYANDALCRLLRRPRADLISSSLVALLETRPDFRIVKEPIYGHAGEYLGCYALLRLAN